jgi:ribosomal protein S15P/S13E
MTVDDKRYHKIVSAIKKLINWLKTVIISPYTQKLQKLTIKDKEYQETALVTQKLIKQFKTSKISTGVQKCSK